MTTMKTTFQQIKVSELKGSTDNPRFSIGGIDELAASITAWGLLQPLVVRKAKEGYEIIAGHRRHAAAVLLGLTTVPCVIRTDKGSVVMQQLVENTQRADLMPYEIAAGINLAIKERKIKQKQLATELGRSEAYVSKFVTIAKAIDKKAAEVRKGNKQDEDKPDEEYESYVLDTTFKALKDIQNHSVDTAYLAAQKYLNPPTPEQIAATATIKKTEEQLKLPELEEKQRLLVIIRQFIETNNMKITGYDVLPAGNAGWRATFAFESAKTFEQAFVEK